MTLAPSAQDHEVVGVGHEPRAEGSLGGGDITVGTKKIFLASSSELKEDRDQFEILINRKNNIWNNQDVFLELVRWEDFLDAISRTRLQDEYNKAIRDCDVFVMLFFTKPGPYTAEEFETAFKQFKATNKPFIFTYFKDAQVTGNNGNLQEQLSLDAFKEKLDRLGHFYTRYKNVEGLQLHFLQQLDKLVANGFIEFKPGKQRPPAPFQSPPPATDHVRRSLELAVLKQNFLDGGGQLLPNTVGLHGFGGTGKTTLALLFCADAAVRQACRDGILWVPLGKNPQDLRAQIADLLAALTGECTGCTTMPGARAQLQAALAGRQLLLVLDDVWNEAHIKDLVQASSGIARLITTRDTNTLPFEAKLVDVAKMEEDDAKQLLAAGLQAGEDARLLILARRLGYWPVLLRLANRTLRQRVRQKMTVSQALDAVERDLARKGVVALDVARDVSERDQAVAATVEASLELLLPAERQRYAELAIFPQDVPIPLGRAAELWRLSAGLEADPAEDLVATSLEPLSLVDYDGNSGLLRLHDVLRSYLTTLLADKALLHMLLARQWSDRPDRSDSYAWRWLAFHRAQAAICSEQPRRHGLSEELVAVVSDAEWQKSHEATLEDLPALRDALASALDAAVADDAPLGLPLVVQAADELARFRRDHLRPGPIFELARQGDLDAARRRSALFSIDDHWRQALLLTVAWLAPPSRRDQARQLYDEVSSEPAPYPTLRDLQAWIRADLWDQAPPVFPFSVDPNQADDSLIEEMLKRVGGGAYNRSFMMSRGLDPDVQNPDVVHPPEDRRLYVGRGIATARYLAELDGPYLVTYAATNPTKGTDALSRYLSVYTNYSYAEYRFATLWLLLEFIVRLPRPDGGPWVQDAVVRVLVSAVGGESVEFEQGLPVAGIALRAQAEDPAARMALKEQAHRLIDEAMRIKPGRDREGSDIWAHHKRLMLANAQALGWLLGEEDLARQVLDGASALADSGFAGYQAPACLALAEAVHICFPGDRNYAAAIEQALEWAQRAAHNVQDPTFCARMTARVNAIRRNWGQVFNLEDRVRRLAEAEHLPELAPLHRVGHAYTGRRPDALQWPPWATNDRSFDDLARLYQRPKADFLRLNGSDRPLTPGEEVAVPDPGFAPHLAARLAAETLAEAGRKPLPPERMRLLRSLTPYAMPSPTALDAVLTRLVLAQARSAVAPDLAQAAALEAVLGRRAAANPIDVGNELIAALNRLPT
jgi:hypothetical protein